MRFIPPEVLLSWPVPNYDNPKTRGEALLIVNGIFISLATITVILRLYTRVFIKRWFGMDDFFIILALVFTIGLTSIVILANQRLGWDRHIWDIPLTLIEPNLKVGMAAKLLFVAASTFTRLSILTFYYRLVTDAAETVFRWLTHVSVALNISMFIAFTFLGVFICVPVENYWAFAAPPGSCIDEGKATLAVGIINCFADAVCTIIPIPLVLKLNMPRRQRIAVSVLFGLGFIVTIAGVVRTWYIYKSLIREFDQTWFAYPLWIAAAVEIDLGVICASAPALRPLISRLPPVVSSLLSKISSSGTSTYATGSSDRVESRLPKSESSNARNFLDLEHDSVPFNFNIEEALGAQGLSIELTQWGRVDHRNHDRTSSDHSHETTGRPLSPIPPPLESPQHYDPGSVLHWNVAPYRRREDWDI